jgi:phosphatidylglycerol:prolipoprotein diacylglycerol transferase
MLTHPNFDPVLLDLGVVKIHWYGLMYVFGFAGAYIVANMRKARLDWNADDVSDLFFYAALGVILGGRIGYCLLYNPAKYLADPLQIILGIQDGGMSFHGGFIGVALAVVWFARKSNTPLANVADFVAVLAPIGLFFGRVGNFINQELWGRATDLPWGMVFSLSNDGIPRHPSMVYEAFFEGLLLFVVLFIFSKTLRKPWSVTGLFLLGYGVSRFMIEFVRIPDAHIGYLLGDWLTLGQIYTLPMVIVGIYLLLLFKKRV